MGVTAVERADIAVAEIRAMPPDVFYAKLTSRNRGLIDEVEQQRLRRTPILIAGCGSIGGAVVEPLVRLGAERLVLVEPDGYELHNLNRQPAALADVGRNKAQVLAERGPVADPGAPILLSRYARRRAEPVLAMQAVTDGLARLFGPPQPWLAALRNAGMAAVDRLPILKRALAQPALR